MSARENNARPRGAPRRKAGFTLIELIIVVVLLGVIGTTIASFITGPMQAYMDQSRRAALVDSADLALRRIGREIHGALPNSVRVSADGYFLELLPVTAAGRYRDEMDAAEAPNPEDWLHFESPDDQFSLVAGTGWQTTTYTDQYLVIYNDGGTGGDAYAGDNRTPNGTTITVTTAGSVRIALGSAFQFPLRSPSKRIFLVGDPITFHCDLANRTLWLRQGYGIVDPQPTSFASGTATPLAKHVEDCAFTYQAGSTARAGVAMLSLVLEESGERVRLLHQVQVWNTP